MKLETKFSLGDEVWTLHRRYKSDKVRCPMCHGTGKVTTSNGLNAKCPESYLDEDTQEWTYTHNVHVNHRTVWVPSIKPTTVGKVSVRVTATKYEEDYMLAATGIGSGALWHAEDMYLSKKDAELACHVRGVDYRDPTRRDK